MGTKFEDERAEYFWEAMLDGDGEVVVSNEQWGESITEFEIGREDIDKFPRLHEADVVWMYVTGDGFVFARAYSRNTANRMRDELSRRA